VRPLTVAVFLAVAGCSDGAEVTKSVPGPAGVAAEIKQSRHGASAENEVEVSLLSADRNKRVSIFRGSGGSDPDVRFQGQHLVVVQYCNPSSYEVEGYLYSLGDDYRFSDIRITAATVESQIGPLHLCKTDGGK
jgi:hypothetical protein